MRLLAEGAVQSLDGRHTLFGEVAEDDGGVVDKLSNPVLRFLHKAQLCNGLHAILR